MKQTKQKMGLVIAALIGVSQVAQANSYGEDFIPLENLKPSERRMFEPQVRLLDQSIKIDWESVILGVNKNGELILKDRFEGDLDMVSQPSCWTEGI